MAERLNNTRKILQLATYATTKAFDSTTLEFNKKLYKSNIKVGDLVYARTTQQGKMHHKLVNSYKGP